MARLHFVKKARKAIPSHGIKVGQSYWWIQFRVGRGSIKRIFAKPPRPSQRTNSEYWKTAYGIQENVEDAVEQFTKDGKIGDLIGVVDDARDELRTLSEETEDKFNNMPDSLQQSETGELLTSRYEACAATADQLDNLEWPTGITEDDEQDDRVIAEADRQEVVDEFESVSWDFE